MADLIDRQAAIDAVLDRMDTEKHGRNAKPEEIKWTLERVPSAQPEIIRCGECVHHVDNFFCRKANHHTSNGDDCMSVFGAERRTDESD